MYFSLTRRDIAYARLSQPIHAWSTVFKPSSCLSYFKMIEIISRKRDSILKNNHLHLEAYMDADWVASMDDWRSTSGYCTYVVEIWWLGGVKNRIWWLDGGWMSSYENGISELLWLKSLMKDLKLLTEGPMRLYCDNKAAINIAHNPIQHDRTKNIAIDTHWIKEEITEDEICMPFVSSRQLADLFTKGVSSRLFQSMVGKFGCWM